MLERPAVDRWCPSTGLSRSPTTISSTPHPSRSPEPTQIRHAVWFKFWEMFFRFSFGSVFYRVSVSFQFSQIFPSFRFSWRPANRFSFESNLESNRQSDSFSNRIESIGILYLWRTRVMYGLRNSELSTCLFQFSHKTRQTILLYAYFTPKVDFKRKFNHHQSFICEWWLTARTIRKFRIGPSIQI